MSLNKFERFHEEKISFDNLAYYQDREVEKPSEIDPLKILKDRLEKLKKEMSEH